MQLNLMRVLASFVWLLLAACLAHPCKASEVRDLILVAGQSNAVGFDTDATSLPVDENDKKVLFWWRCGDPPPDKYDSTCEGKWTTLQVQPQGKAMMRSNQDQGEKQFGTKRQYGNFRNSAGFGPEIGLARTLCANGATSLAILKVAFSGTGMRTDWNPADQGDGGACYRALISETKTAIDAAQKAGITLRLKALVWVQGENDANPKDAMEYEQRLGDMLAALRRDFNAPTLVALVSVNPNFNNHVASVIKAQQALAAADPLVRYVDCKGAQTANAAHFSTTGTLEIGKRFAEALRKVESGQ
jgi:hypothetical protein